MNSMMPAINITYPLLQHQPRSYPTASTQILISRLYHILHLLPSSPPHPPPFHVVSVQEPPLIHSKMLALNYLVLGDTQQYIFSVKIDAAENVGTLKKFIKEEKKNM